MKPILGNYKIGNKMTLQRIAIHKWKHPLFFGLNYSVTHIKLVRPFSLNFFSFIFSKRGNRNLPFQISNGFTDKQYIIPLWYTRSCGVNIHHVFKTSIHVNEPKYWGD